MKQADQLAIRDDVVGAILAVKAVPGSSRDKIAGVLGDALKVTTSAAPEKGKANQAIARVLAKALGVNAKDVQIVAGLTNPHKEFRIATLDATSLRVRLAEL